VEEPPQKIISIVAAELLQDNDGAVEIASIGVVRQTEKQKSQEETTIVC
jgi:hypothetical protein